MNEARTAIGRTKEEIKSPSRYRDGGPLESIEAIFGSGWGEGFVAGSINKYMRRYKSKGGIEDLRKCKVYLDFLIAYEEGGMKGLSYHLNELAIDKMRFDKESIESSPVEYFPFTEPKFPETKFGSRDTINECASVIHRDPLGLDNVGGQCEPAPEGMQRRVPIK